MKEIEVITLAKYLEDGGELPDNLGDFEELTIDENTYNVGDLFTLRCRYKVLDKDEQELFKHNLEVLINDALTIYNPQLKVLNENFADLMKRVVQESTSGSTSSQLDDREYLNPSNTTANKLVNRGEQFRSGNYSETRSRSFGFFKSNPDILKAVQEIKTVINEILKYLDKAFIGVY